MPPSKHFGGKGAKVMKSMQKTYGSTKKAERVFYATENKQKREHGSMKALHQKS